MQGQQYVLDDVFDVFGTQEFPVTSHDAAYSRRNFLQQLNVGVRIASLRSLHETSEMAIFNCPVHDSHGQ
jgi:hypothetical protein